jgi:hypothetical protein
VTASSNGWLYPWWLWPNLLCLDAPLVTVLWQRFLAFALGVRIPVAAGVALAGVVWGIYLLDHWLDGRAEFSHEWASRHLLARRHSVAFLLAAGSSFLLAFLVALAGLAAPYWYWGLALGAGVIAYLAAVHFSPFGRPLRRGGKELAVGIVIGIGVGLPLVAEAPDRFGEWWPAVGGFAALCWLNCRLIATWEAQPGTVGSWKRLTIAATLTALGAISAPRPVAVAFLWSLALLGGLHLVRRRLADAALRVLADAALLTPIPVWLLS